MLVRLQADKLPQKCWEETVGVWTACAALAVLDAPVIDKLCAIVASLVQ